MTLLESSWQHLQSLARRVIIFSLKDSQFDNYGRQLSKQLYQERMTTCSVHQEYYL